MEKDMKDFTVDLFKFFVPAMFMALLMMLITSYSPYETHRQLPLTQEWSYSEQEFQDIVPLVERARWCRKRIDCRKMAEAIVYEARGESDRGKYSVAWVIRNRAESPRWRDTIVGVITQPAQFSYLQDMHLQKKPSEKDWTTAYIVAYDVLNDRVSSPIGDATHYHTTKVNPRWASQLQLTTRIDNHVFYE
ncbi:Spore cortex-lytic enzyme precursor [compost metagenome]